MSSPRQSERGLNPAIIVAVGTVSMQVLMAVSGIIGARMLGVEGRGQVALVAVVSSMASVLTLGSSLPAAIATELARRGVTARDGLRHLFPRWCALALVPAVLAGGYILQVMEVTPLQRVLLAILTVVATLQAMAARVMVGAMQGELASIVRLIFVSLLPSALSTVLLVVAFIAGWDWDAVDFLTATAAMWTLGLLLSMRFLRRPRRDPADQLDGRKVRQLARANYVGAMAPIDGLGFDRTLIGTLMGTSALGLYAAATALGNLPGLIGSAVGTVLLPRVAAQQSLPARRRLIASWLAAAAAGTTIVVVPLVLTAGPLIHFAFGDEFMGAVEVARWLIVAQGILGFRRVFIMALQGLGRGAVASVVEVGLTVVMVAGVVFVAVRESLVGAAMVMLGVGCLSCLLLAALLVRALRPEPSLGAGSRALLVELGGGGHRFHYVRLLAEQALDRGAQVTLLTRVDPVTRDHLEMHLGDLLDRIEVVELDRPVWSDVEQFSRSWRPDMTVVPEADHYLVRLLARGGWRGPGQLSLLVMRARVPSVGTPIRSAFANVIKVLSVTTVLLLPRIRVRVLRGQMWRTGGWWPSLNDPATLLCSPDDVARLRREWGLDSGRYWIGVLGAVTENKNLPLVAEVASSIAADRPIGLLVAGRVSPSIQPSLPAFREQLTAAGAAVVIHDRLLTDLELDAAVAAVDCLALAYSHNGPSGTFGKALLAGTRIVAAGSPALRRDCDAAPGITSWVPLRVPDVTAAIRDAMDASAPEPVHVPGAKEFATALLGPAASDDLPTGPTRAQLLAAEEDTVHLKDSPV
ncbi:MAG TPA: oligosaccharide flippase family protein [Aeromicrobium sp.]|nr:oligosaccharide flippase family protein [Aeromicrobium sp.]